MPPQQLPNRLNWQHRACQKGVGVAVLTSSSCRVCKVAVSAARASSNPGFAVVFEVDGVLADLHQDGHRVAFNRAFKELGFECTQWSAPVYNDLLSYGDGTGEGLVRTYFNRVGWPTFLPSSEHEVFTAKVHSLKHQQLQQLVREHAIPLRADVDKVLQGAAAAGGVLIGVSHALASLADDVSSAIISKLPLQLAQQLHLYSPASQGALGQSTSSSSSSTNTEGGEFSSSSLAAAAAQVKQQGARQFVEQLRQDMSTLQRAGVPVTVDAGLLLAAGSQPAVTADWLSAIAALHQVPCECCLVLAASGSSIRAAAAAGMVPVAIPRAAAFAAAYPGAKAKFEGFGPGYATWPRLHALLMQQCSCWDMQ